MATATNETYGEWLRREMQERGVSRRELARRLNPDNPEVARRSVGRYLKGMVPVTRTRDQIASALGTSETGPDDQEDD